MTSKKKHKRKSGSAPEMTRYGQVPKPDTSPKRHSCSQNMIMASYMEQHPISDDLSSLSLEGPSHSDQMKMQMAMESVLLEAMDQPKGFILSDMLPVMAQGLSVVLDDGFHKCFTENLICPWNFTPTLYFLWCIGIVIRFGILFPLRLILLAIGVTLALLAFVFVPLFMKSNEAKNAWKCRCMTFLSGAFVVSWSGIIRYHGQIPEKKPNQIYCSNHSSMIDVAILLQKAPFAIVGQHHAGWVAFFQDYLLSCLGPIWFQRGAIKDRATTALRIKEHIEQPNGTRLLIFPEGTCVNNRYCVQFKKGIFEMDAEICPIAIMYNKQFVDPFWNSRARPFHLHLFDLMTGWMLVADVWFLPPVNRNPDESAIEFASRVKEMIATTAELINVEWDGYLKYVLPSARFMQKRQKAFSEGVLKKLEFLNHKKLQNREVGGQSAELRERNPYRPETQ